MHIRASRKATIGGYVFLGIALAALAFFFAPQTTFWTPHFWETVTGAAAAVATASVTVTTFFLWDSPLSDKLEVWFGPVGHAMHCGYCLSLWLSAGATTVLGIAFFPSLPSVFDFLLSWWALGAFAVLIHEAISVGWLQKVAMVAKTHERLEARKRDGLTNAKDLQ